MDRSKENRAKKKDQYNEYYRKWRKDHNWKEYIHNYYLRNKQRLLEKAKKDPLYLEKKNVTWHKRKARLLGNGGTHTIKEWQDLKEKYENKCAECRQEKKLTKDHVIPICKGGTNNIENIQPLCQSCNSSKGKK